MDSTCIQHRYTILLSIPLKMMGAIHSWTNYRECSVCGHRAPASAVRDSAWRDAYLIAWIGASNPKAVQRALDTHSTNLGESYPAVRAIRGHLAFLQGTSLGPDSGELDEVRLNGQRLGF